MLSMDLYCVCQLPGPQNIKMTLRDALLGSGYMNATVSVMDQKSTSTELGLAISEVWCCKRHTIGAWNQFVSWVSLGTPLLQRAVAASFSAVPNR